MSKITNKTFNINLSHKNFDISEDKEYIDIEGWATKNVNQDGTPKIDLDDEHVSSSGFDLQATRLFLNHDITQSVGELTLEHKPEGIWLKARAYKDTMEEKEFNRLRRGLYSFSIGFKAVSGEYIEVQGDDILSFTKGTIYEVSLVALPSNDLATIESMKSFSDKECQGIQCSINSLKAMNPDKECGCKGKDMKDLLDKIKGLTLEETEQESWNQERKFMLLLDNFQQTLYDNFDGNIWWEEISKEEALNNIKQAMETFTDRVNDMLINSETEADVTKGKIEREDMKKDAQPQEEVQEVETKDEPTEELPKEEIQEEVEEKPETDEPTNEPTEKEEAPEAEPQEEVQEVVEEVSEPKAEPLDIKNEVIEILGADLDTTEPEKIQELYDNLADKLGDLFSAHEALSKIEEFVKRDLEEA